MAAIAGCYLLHFESTIHGKQHYLGWSRDVLRRVRLHMRGKGARLVRQAINAGIAVELVRLWATSDRREERRLKRSGPPKRHCPLCRGRARDGNAASREVRTR